MSDGWPANRLSKREFATLLKLMKKSCDRDWKDETPEQIVTIFANADYWRNWRNQHDRE